MTHALANIGVLFYIHALTPIKFLVEFFMEETRINVQIQPIQQESLEEEMTPMAISYTQSTIKEEQPLQEKGMSVQELVAKHMNKGKDMVNMSFEGQHESFPSILDVAREEEDLSHHNEIT